MRRLRFIPVAGLVFIALAVAVALTVPAVVPAAAVARGGFRIGILDNHAYGPRRSGVLFDRMRAAGATIARISLAWRSVAPSGTYTRPQNFNPRDHADSRYDWHQVDAFVRNALARGLEPMITLYYAPQWAEGDGNTVADRKRGVARWGAGYRVSPSAVGDFAHALARRYSGRASDRYGVLLPRVRYFQAWNEPNYSTYLVGTSNGGPKGGYVSPVGRYVAMLNSFYKNVKGVDASNVVVSAGLGPYGSATQTAPQRFLRAMLCLRLGNRSLDPAASCHYQPHFDVLAVHPYTLGRTPTSGGRAYTDVGLANLGEVHRTLARAVELGHAYPRRAKAFWVTEFDWISNPPARGSRRATPMRLVPRYFAEAAYRMWRAGVSTMIWFELRDLTARIFYRNTGGRESYWPGGLYFEGESFNQDRPKAGLLRAFGFPFFATRFDGRVHVWAVTRTPRVWVRIERRDGGRWREVARRRTDAGRVVFFPVSRRGGLYRVQTTGRHARTSYPIAVR